MSWKLAELLAPWTTEISGDAALEVTGLAYDSRRIAQGDLFVALKGAESDGHTYLEAAVVAGAHAVLIDDPSHTSADRAGARALARVQNTRKILPELAARFFREPAREMTLIAVTGTNGKTSTVRLLESLLTYAGRRTGSLGTISTRFAGREVAALLTTPESVDLHANLRMMRDAGVDHAALEVSSHSLEAGRVRGLRFAAAAFTNLTQDHLDFHGDMETYARAKQRLFEPELLAGPAILPLRDPLLGRLRATAEAGGQPCLTFGREAREGPRADVLSTEEDVRLEGSSFRLHTPGGSAQVELPLPGDFQIDNALAAAACAVALGIPTQAIADGLGRCPPVPGRLERVSETLPLTFVDYAHTPDALEQVLRRIRPGVRGRLICVFGCGGDRDRSKRAPMARAACAHSDVVIATSDNPRTEDPERILSDVACGLSAGAQVITDRREAITAAILIADPEDVVLIAGKGHETYQIIGRERHAFDDREVARAALDERSARE